MAREFFCRFKVADLDEVERGGENRLCGTHATLLSSLRCRKSKEFKRSPSEHAESIVSRKAQALHEFARPMFTERKRVVAPERKSIRTYKRVEITKRRSIMDKCVEVEARDLVAWRDGALRGAEVGAFSESMRDAPNRERERTASVRETNAQCREPIENSAHHECACCARRFGGHAHEPRHPVLRHLRLTKHVPWVQEHSNIKCLAALKEGEELRFVEVRARDVCSDLHAAHAEFTHAPLELAACKIRILHRNATETDEPRWMCGNNGCDVIVQKSMQLHRLACGLLIHEHDRDGGQHLRADCAGIALAYASRRVPAVGLDLAKGATIKAELRAIASALLDREPARASIASSKIWPLGWKDVRVNVERTCLHAQDAIRQSIKRFPSRF